MILFFSYLKEYCINTEGFASAGFHRKTCFVLSISCLKVKQRNVLTTCSVNTGLAFSQAFCSSRKKNQGMKSYWPNWQTQWQNSHWLQYRSLFHRKHVCSKG